MLAKDLEVMPRKKYDKSEGFLYLNKSEVEEGRQDEFGTISLDISSLKSEKLRELLKLIPITEDYREARTKIEKQIYYSEVVLKRLEEYKEIVLKCWNGIDAQLEAEREKEKGSN